MAGPHQPEIAATTDLPNQINNVCMYVCVNTTLFLTIREYNFCKTEAPEI